MPLSFVLAQCGKAPNRRHAGRQFAGFRRRYVRRPLPEAAIQGSFPDREREPGAAATAGPIAPTRSGIGGDPPPTGSHRWHRQLPYQRPAREDQTTLVSLKSSAFPYFGNNPRTDEPFLNISKGERRGHRSYGGRVFWQDETFNDNRVLMHVPENFDVRKPGVIVVFFHGNGATLERDVRDRQLVPQQISDSGVNAVLLAPQLAVDAADSSAGKFWQPGGLKRFVAESADHLAALYGDPRAAKAFANMPVIIVGYSGGFVPTAWSLEVGGLGNRVRGVFLLDAVYGELDKFASWIENNRIRLFRQFLYPLHQAARRRTDAHAEGKGHRRLRRHGRAVEARQRGVRRDARGRDASRLRHAGLDRKSGQGSAGQDGGDAGADAGCGQRVLARQPIIRCAAASAQLKSSSARVWAFARQTR